MPISLHPLVQADIPAFVNIELEAFRSHPRMPMLFPRGYTPDLYAFYHTSKLKAFNDPESRMWKAVDDESGEIIGCLQMTVKVDGDGDANEVESGNSTPMDGWPEGGNWEMRQWFARNGRKMIEESFRGRGFTIVDFLVIHPRHQGKGIGSQLIDAAVKEADEKRLPLGLESTPAGLSLYKRFGFQEVKTIKADMRDFGWTEPYDHEAAKRVWMVRERRL